MENNVVIEVSESHVSAETSGKIPAHLDPNYTEPVKETFLHVTATEAPRHAEAARMLMPLSVPPETEFLRAYAAAIEGNACTPGPGENPKAVTRGIEAASEKLPITTALRRLEKFLAASYRGSFKSEAKTLALRHNAQQPRTKLSDPKNIRQPLTVSATELDLVHCAAKKAEEELCDFCRGTVLAVCAGGRPFAVPTTHSSENRDKQYQLRWTEAEWAYIGTTSEKYYGTPTGKRSNSGPLVREAILARAREILGEV